MLIYERFISWYRCLLGNHPKDKVPFEEVGLAIAEERFSDVLVLLKPVLQRNPRNVYALVMRSCVHRFLGNLDEAWRDANLAVKQAPAYVGALSHRGYLARSTGDFDLAKADLEKAIRIHPRDGIRYFEMARCWCDLLEYRQATEAYQLALDLGYDSWECWEEAGNCHAELEDWEKSFKCFDSGLQRHNDALLLLRARGTALTFLGNYHEALVDFDRYLDREPDDVLALNNRCFCYLKLGSWSAAKQDLDRLFAIDPEYSPSWKNLAILQSQSTDWSFRDPGKAVESAIKAMDLSEWKVTKWLPVLADAYESAGDHAKAAEFRKRLGGTVDRGSTAE